jgi:GMP synthase-like glutamine amidotransferase
VKESTLNERESAAGVRKRVAYVAQLALPPSLPATCFARLLGGTDEAAAFGGLIESLGLGDEVELCAVHADQGEVPLLDYDAVVLGGSFASVNDELPWQTRLLNWIPQYRAAGRPLLGICGGHQLVARAFGGTVRRRASGPVLGTLPVTLTDAGRQHWLFEGLGAAPRFQFANFDHVAQLPESAVLLASREEIVAAADYGDGWVTTQFHPEVACDRLATYWHALVEDDELRFSFAAGAERLIGNFLHRALKATLVSVPDHAIP